MDWESYTVNNRYSQGKLLELIATRVITGIKAISYSLAFSCFKGTLVSLSQRKQKTIGHGPLEPYSSLRILISSPTKGKEE